MRCCVCRCLMMTMNVPRVADDDDDDDDDVSCWFANTHTHGTEGRGGEDGGRERQQRTKGQRER